MSNYNRKLTRTKAKREKGKSMSLMGAFTWIKKGDKVVAAKRKIAMPTSPQHPLTLAR